jgi:hypothetical protein
MTGTVTSICRAPGAKKTIRVSYLEGAILTDWIAVEELPSLKADWPAKPSKQWMCKIIAGMEGRATPTHFPKHRRQPYGQTWKTPGDL